jgi:hypothetical protein
MTRCIHDRETTVRRRLRERPAVVVVVRTRTAIHLVSIEGEARLIGDLGQCREIRRSSARVHGRRPGRGVRKRNGVPDARRPRPADEVFGEANGRRHRRYVHGPATTRRMIRT